MKTLITHNKAALFGKAVLFAIALGGMNFGTAFAAVEAKGCSTCKKECCKKSCSDCKKCSEDKCKSCCKKK
jgi:hypothetical protein